MSAIDPVVQAARRGLAGVATGLEASAIKAADRGLRAEAVVLSTEVAPAVKAEASSLLGRMLVAAGLKRPNVHEAQPIIRQLLRERLPHTSGPLSREYRFVMKKLPDGQYSFTTAAETAWSRNNVEFGNTPITLHGTFNQKSRTITSLHQAARVPTPAESGPRNFMEHRPSLPWPLDWLFPQPMRL
jgi:hypothetical protein